MNNDQICLNTIWQIPTLIFTKELHRKAINELALNNSQATWYDFN